MNRSDFGTCAGFRIFLIFAMAISAMTLSSAAFAQQELPAMLSSGDLQNVTKWIAQEVSNQRQPFCFRESYGRGIGSPMKCKPGEDQDAGLCYTPCKAGYKGVGPVCWQSCTPGFRDDGAFCAKPGPYGRGTGYPWKFGDPLNDSGMIKRCEAEHGKDNCEKNGLIYYPKCKPGFHAVGCCVCSPNCPPGQADIGVSCAKQSYGRGVGAPLSTCPADKEKDALLCYQKCRSGFHGVGPVCWQNCPPGRVDCGAGCSTSKNACVSETMNMVMPGLQLAVNITKMGASMAADSVSRLTQISQKAKQLAAASMDPREIAKQVQQAGTVPFELNKTTLLWVNDYVGNFTGMTNPKVVNELSKNLNGNPLLWVKQQYAKNHLALLLKADGLQSPEKVLSMVSSFDPAGLNGVFSAFQKPICKTDTPFPVVRVVAQGQQVTPAKSTTLQPAGPVSPLKSERRPPLRPTTPQPATAVTWVPNSPAVANQAFIGGNEPGRSLPVCRAPYGGGVHPGKVVAGNCNIGWGGNEITIRNYEVMLRNNANLVWVPGPSATGMVIGGHENGINLPICRAGYQSGVHPGKIVAGKCNIGWGGKEIVLPRFEVLVQK